MMTVQEATLSGDGPYIITNREELSSAGSVVRRSLETVPRDSNKIFKVIDKGQVQHADSKGKERLNV